MLMQRTALVTGATRGIGKVIALALGRAGFTVVVTGRTLAAGTGHHDAMGGVPVPGSIEETVAEIKAAGGAAYGVRLDLADRASIDGAVQTTLERSARIDLLVNNGIYQGPSILQKVMDIDLADAERATAGNFINQFHLSRLVLKAMIQQGGGRMIFMSTRSSVEATETGGALFYTGPKAAFNHIPDYINFEHRADGISAFLIEPAFTMTDTLRSAWADAEAEVGLGTQPRDPQETADTVVWMATHPDAPRFAGAQLYNAPDFFADHQIAAD
ncbi:MAG TPA: SDR family oxidoreductase [Sphingobium sp.]|nr:SDR family oxidoreductase [Sphingobium sp.]